MAASGSVVQSVVSGTALIGFYGFVFWRIVKQNAGNRVIESGVLALAVAFVMVAAMKIPNLPDWVAPSLGILFLLLGFLMILFLDATGIQGYSTQKTKFISGKEFIWR